MQVIVLKNSLLFFLCHLAEFFIQSIFLFSADYQIGFDDSVAPMRIIRSATNRQSDEMIVLVMLGVSVGIAILAHLPLLEFVGEVDRGSNRFGIPLYAYCLLDIRLGHFRVDRARRHVRIGQITSDG